MTGHSLRLRMFLAIAGSVAAALVLAFWGLGVLFSSHVERRAIDELSVQLDQILAGVERDADGQIFIGSAPADARFTRPFGGLYWQIEVETRQLRSRSLWDFAIDLPPDLLGDGAVHVHDLPGPGGNMLLVMERSVQLPARLGGTDMRAAVAMDASRIEEGARQFRRDLLPYTLLLALFLLAAGVVQVLVGLRPLNKVERRVAQIRSGERTRVGDDFPDEITPLTAEVDLLLAQREADIEQARQRAGDLAHGLKTPLQALLGEAERLRAAGAGEAAGAIEQVTETMRRHVDRELNRVRIASRAVGAESDLGAAARRIIAVIQRARPGAGPAWQIDLPKGVLVAAALEDLSEILGALLENAARHARATVRLCVEQGARAAVLTILDDGPGIAPEQIEQMMKRGARADESGTGLGLAIARELAEALGGSVELASRQPGLEVRVTLPLAAT